MIHIVVLVGLALVMYGTAARGEHRGRDVDHRGGVGPANELMCPFSHPVKGNFTPRSGERCIHHPPRHRDYDGAKPQRCYATEGEAQADGCRRADG